ncbi:MAG: DNA adenine methylase [Patescibacteria group bacterium]|nr:DNA adenine methylase [Patescibacteria group bacterium]
MPYFGGKSRAAEEIWKRLGDVKNYVEPFCGSLAIPLARPHDPGIETVNDKDRFIANFWRALQAEPDAVAHHADWPVNEADLESRHYWLVSEGAKRLSALMADPGGHDAKIAGWWVWGQCCWIGSGWCSGNGPWSVGPDGWVRNAGQGINRQLPHLRNAGQGINRQLPHLGDAGKGIREYLNQIACRIRRIRVCCGDWSRVLTPSVTFRHGMTGVVLDPPYGEGEVDYSAGGNADNGIAEDAARWALTNGENPDLRIALCGYEGQFDMPESWFCFAWKAAGGYSATAFGNSAAKSNRHRERIWFSPHCIPAKCELPESLLIPA